MKEDRPWIAFFSQTGSEIVEVSKALGRWPDLIVTNQRPDHLRKIHPELEGRVAFVENKPTVVELQLVLKMFKNPIVTLHGWLRIMPGLICNEYEIYNGHPGLITEHEILKGKDPQERAYTLRLEYSGCVIHKVTAGVDDGPILMSKRIKVRDLELNEVFKVLHDCSIKMWIDFLKSKHD